MKSDSSESKDHAQQIRLSLLPHREDLADRIRRILVETLYASRAYIRPADLKPLAVAETNAFFEFLQHPDDAQTRARGAHVCQIGLSEEAILRIGRTLRRCCHLHLEDGLLLFGLEIVDEYHSALIQGFIRKRDTIILEEQERIRAALQQTLSRYTVQVETAADVGRAATSILDLNKLLTVTVDLICKRFDLDYVGIHLLDESGDWAILRAGTGELGRRLLAQQYAVKIGGPSPVSACIVKRREVSAASAGQADSGDSLAPSIGSEMALPLVAKNRVVGAVTVQTGRPQAFSSLDVTGFQIMADQLANAIDNARLYAEARRRADELAEAYARLQELDRLKDEFMQNIAHELRTPLTIIGGYAEFLVDESLGGLSESQRNAVQIILSYSQALTALVADIMAILEARAQKIQLTPVSLIEVSQAAVANFQRMAMEQRVTLRADVKLSENVSPVMAEPDHVRRILDNLISNALKFTPAGGEVVVQLRQNGDDVILQVADTGIGIPLEMQERVFDRFYQVDGSIRRRFGGTGLGLSLVKQLVESYGGRVSLTSPGVDQGTTFTVCLPQAGSPAAVSTTEWSLHNMISERNHRAI